MKYLFLTYLIVINCYQGSAQHPFMNIQDYGAVGDGETLNTGSIQAAIDDCAVKGGGTVYIPAGRFITGTIFLKNHVALHLESGAVLEGSKNLIDYPITISRVRSYTDNYTNKSLIYGEDLENISIKGKGTINGNGASFKTVRMPNDEDVRKKDDFAYYKNRPYLIRIINSKNILLRDITLLNSPMWVQHYLLCSDVNIDGITVHSDVNQNNDGIDIDACDNVRISNCNIVSGDDAIVLKSSLDKPCRNIVVSNCLISSRCNGFKLGTESNGNFENINVSNCIIYDTRLAGICLLAVDGGSLKNVNVSDITMERVGCAIFVRLGNRARPFNTDSEKPGIGNLSGIIINNIQGTEIGTVGSSINGLPSYPVKDITLSNIRLRFLGGDAGDQVNRQIGEFPEKYPEHNMFGTLPSFGFFLRHVNNLVMDNIDLSYEKPDYRPALFLSDVNGSRISDLKASAEDKTESLIVIDESHDLVLRDCNVPRTGVILANIRKKSSGILIINKNHDLKNLFKRDNSVLAEDLVVK